MDIEFVEKDDIFKALEVGAVFKWGNDFYMKIEPIEAVHLMYKINAIHIETGIGRHLADFTHVIPVKAKMMIGG